MSKKDYIKIAAALAEALAFARKEEPHPALIVDKLVSRLCYILLDDNPNFDDIRFREAVYGNNENA